MKLCIKPFINWLVGYLLLFITPALAQNLALNKAATASSEINSNAAVNALDGNRTTRWESAYSDPQSIVVDLGSLQKVDRIRLYWETAYGTSFTLDVSADNSTWTTVVSESANMATTTEYAHLLAQSNNASANVRYVRLVGTARATQYGYSLYEFEVYSYSASDNLALGKPGTASTSQSGFPTQQAFDDDDATRWGSQYDGATPDSAYLYVDLQSRAAITQIGLYWETAYASDYKLEVSDDAQMWHGLVRVSGNAQQTNVLDVVARGRYVRMHALQRATRYGYSLWEFVVLGTYEPLPVTLTSFQAIPQRAGVAVNWSTASEQGTASFEVQRSADGVQFANLSRVAGAGVSLRPRAYQYLDVAPLHTTGYYRLQQFDLDGKFTYSSVVAVSAQPEAVLDLLSPYPNPTDSSITLILEAPASATGRWYLTSTTGQVIHTESLSLQAGSNTLVFNLTPYPAGRYLLHVEAAGQVVRHAVVQKK